jgi:hypothetical protein
MSHPLGIMVDMGREREVAKEKVEQPSLISLPEPGAKAEQRVAERATACQEPRARFQEAGLVGIAWARTVLAEAVRKAEARAEEERRARRAA